LFELHKLNAHQDRTDKPPQAFMPNSLNSSVKLSSHEYLYDGGLENEYNVIELEVKM